MALVLGAIVFACTLLAATAYRGALREADALFDEQLQQMARSVQSGAPLGLVPPSQDEDEPELNIQIWGPDGVQIFRSPRSVLPPRAILGFSDVDVNGRHYRVYSIQTPLQTVQIAQDMSERNARARSLAFRSVLPLLGVAPLLILAVGWIITRALAPVQRMQRQVASRDASDLSPLIDQGLPSEVQPLVNELNLLFGRVQRAFDQQTNFVADAAHELRSPLTALRLQVQALQRASDPTIRDQWTQQLEAGIERSIALVQQLLLLAREDSAPSANLVPEPVDLLDLTRAVVAELMPLASAKSIDLGVAHGEQVMVNGRATALQTLLRNLVDNALKYTPAPGQVDVSLSQIPGQGAQWLVEDSGPGIAEAERERAFDRFRRGERVSDVPGSGLGLAIVQAVARQHGATVSLGASPRLGGLRVQVDLPSNH